MIILDETQGEKRLLKSTTERRAVDFVVKGILKLKKLSPDEVAEAMSEGVEMIDVDAALDAAKPTPDPAATNPTEPNNNEGGENGAE